MKKININLFDKYTIFISEKLLENSFIPNFCSKLASTVVIISDNNMIDLYGKQLLGLFSKAKIRSFLLSFDAKESNKTREVKQQIEDQLFELGCGKDTCLIALGGGITTDIVGFIASTYCRGIPVCYIPTTLLAMSDACVGGKTGVNVSFGKNLIGAFSQPRAVFVAVNTLKTLSLLELKNGIVEIIKHALILDSVFFNYLMENVDSILSCDFNIMETIIVKSCNIKKNIVERDVKDTGIRNLLNFGHTIGHALEKNSDYQITHGNAVALGIIVESYISTQFGYLSEESFYKIKSIFEKYQISLSFPASCSKEAVKQSLKYDKKSIKQLPYFVLLDNIGQTHLSDTGYTVFVPDEVIDLGLNEICLL